MLMFYISMLETEADRRKFADIYTKYEKLYFYVALKVTGNKTLAEDAVHNALLSIIKHKDEIFNLNIEEIKKETVIIVKHKAIDLMRMENHRTHEQIDELEDENLTDKFDVSEYVENKEAYNYLIDAIMSLPEKYKLVMYLRYVYGKSNQIIAEQLDMKPKTVSMRIARAKNLLQGMLNEGVT